MPSTSSQDAAIKAIHDLTHAIKYPTAATPTLLLGDEKTHALETLAKVFNSSIRQPEPSRKQDNIRQEPRVVDIKNNIKELVNSILIDIWRKVGSETEIKQVKKIFQ